MPGWCSQQRWPVVWLIGCLVAAPACSGDLVRGAGEPDVRQRADTAVGDTSSFRPEAGPTDAGAETDATGTVDGADADAGSDADTGPDADADASERGGPPYPIVLAHGFAGFDHLADVDQMPYYFDVRQALEAAGEPVYVAEVDPFNDSTVRGKQLVARIEEIVAETRWEHVNIIGHSQGGLDARYAAHHRPELVASVVTIATPHRGTPIADIVLKIADHDLFRDIADEVVTLVGKPLYDEAGDKTSLFEALEQMSEPGMEAFNEEITDQPGILYVSITGRSGMRSGEEFCEPDEAPPFLAKWQDERDPVDPLLNTTNDALEGSGWPPVTNDGLVRVEQAKWGEFLGCIPADHLDQIGQVAGDDPGVGNAFDHVEFYRDLVGYLRGRGF